MNDHAALPAGVLLALVLAVLVLLALWCLLPFAVFGTKPLLRKLLSEAQHQSFLLGQTKSAMEELARQLARQGTPPTPPPS